MCVNMALLFISAALEEPDTMQVQVDESGSVPFQAPHSDPSIQQFAQEYTREWQAQQRAQWDLPNEPAVFDLNSCAICEAVAFDGAASMLRWHQGEKTRLAAIQRQQAKKPKAAVQRMDVGRLIEDIEASCADQGKWRKQYRQRVANAGGEPFMVLMGPGIEPLPGKEKLPAVSSRGSRQQQSTFADLEGQFGGADDDEHEEDITQEIVNTLVRDCGTLLGELEDEELQQLALEASAANGTARTDVTSSRHEDDHDAAMVLRQMLCTRQGAEARCKMAATDRKHGFTPMSTKRKRKTKRGRKR